MLYEVITGQIMLAPMPVGLLKPGSVSKPLPGIEVDLVDREGKRVPQDKGGLLVIKRPCVITSYSIHYTKLYDMGALRSRAMMRLPMAAWMMTSKT